MKRRDKRIPSRMDGFAIEAARQEESGGNIGVPFIITRNVSWEQPVATCRSGEGRGPRSCHFSETEEVFREWMSRVSAKRVF